MRLFNFDEPSHRDAIALLPWYVNDTLDGIERARVEAHVRECVACHGELEAQRSLRELVRRQDVPPALSTALARMHARMDEHPASAVSPLQRAAGWLRPRWLGWVALAQAVCIVALLAVPGVREQARFHTLSSGAPAQAAADAVVVVFDGHTTQVRLQALLRRLDAHIVGGPNTQGAYTLKVPAGRQAALLRALQQDPDVLFAQPAPAGRARGG
jgi:hypothetical protein